MTICWYHRFVGCLLILEAKPKPTKQQWQIISEYAPTDLQYLVLGRTKPLLLMKEKQYSIP